jgi:hypothetical protein
MAARSERSTAKPKSPTSEAPKTGGKTPPKSPPKATPAPPPARSSGKIRETPAKETPKKVVPAAKPSGAVKASKPTTVPPGAKAEEKPAKAAKVEEKASKPAKSAKVEEKVSKPVKAAKVEEKVSKPAKAAKVEEKASKPAKVEAKGGGLKPRPGGKVLSTRPARSLPIRVPTSKLPLRVVPPPKQYTLEERSKMVEDRLARTSEEFRKNYQDRFNMSWVFHDAALEGVVYNEQELRTALDPSITVVADSSLQPVCDEIRRYKEAILYCQDQALKKRPPVTTDTIKKIYLILHPEEGDLKSVKYRKEIPQHRLYFHEYAAPDKIGSKVRQIVDWVNDPETRKGRNTLRIAGRAHFDLLRAFPFPTDSGRVARLFMNLLLMRAGYPPAIMHSTDRQRYYEALKGSAVIINNMVQEAIENALASIEKILDDHEARGRAPA